MQVNKIELINFRNYEEKIMEFKSGVNIIKGPNAIGKTNILEGISMFSIGKSNRAVREADTIRHGESRARLKMEFTARGRENTAEIEIFKNKRKIIKVNDIPIKKSSLLLGKFNAVYFGPEYLSLVKDGPSIRRKNTDIIISQLRPAYFEEISKYKKIIENKSAMLKSGNINSEVLSIFNETLAGSAASITVLRREYIKKIEETASKIQSEISGGREELSIKYISSIGNIEGYSEEEIRESYISELSRIKSRETERRECLIGTHRDDIEYLINGYSAKKYGSQGQQKTCVLVQKIAEVYLIKNEIGEYPVLLLDDIMSELDGTRQNYVMKNIKDMQIIITSADEAFADNNYLI